MEASSPYKYNTFSYTGNMMLNPIRYTFAALILVYVCYNELLSVCDEVDANICYNVYTLSIYP